MSSSTNQEILLPMGTAYRGSVDLIREGLPKKEKHSTLALSILRYVDRNPEVAQGELGRILRRDPMTMSQAIRSLQNAGLVTSHPDAEDKRVKRLTVTKKGRQLSESLRENETRLLQGLARVWGKSRVNQFTRDMVEFNEFLSRFGGN